MIFKITSKFEGCKNFYRSLKFKYTKRNFTYKSHKYNIFRKNKLKFNTFKETFLFSDAFFWHDHIWGKGVITFWILSFCSSCAIQISSGMNNYDKNYKESKILAGKTKLEKIIATQQKNGQLFRGEQNTVHLTLSKKKE